MSHEDSYEGDEEKEVLEVNDSASRDHKLESPSGAMNEDDDDDDDDDDKVGMEPADTLESYAKIGRILNVTIPAILLNAAQPASLTIQTAMYGRKSTNILAAFGAVNQIANACSFLFNYLIDGVASKVGESVGAKKWGEVGGKVRLAFACAVCAGIVASGLLAALQQPIFSLFGLDRQVRKLAKPFWWLRVAQVLPQLLIMAATGILQGYERVKLVALINTIRAILECGTAAIAIYSPSHFLGKDLIGVGVGSILATVVALILGIICIIRYPPTTSRDQIRIFHSRDKTEPDKTKLEIEDQQDKMFSFILDGLNMLIRSTLLQASSFLALGAASRLGTKSLGAHSIVAQLWMLTSYIVDGFATAGTVLGSQLYHLRFTAEGSKTLKKLFYRLIAMGSFVGIAVCAGFLAFQENVVSVFTHDHDIVHILKSSKINVWYLLSFSQPLNAALFVYDGLLYAGQAFFFVRNLMLSGFVLIFLPLLAYAAYWKKSLSSVWIATAALNIWRTGGAVYWIHFYFLRASSSHSAPLKQPLLDDTS